MPWCPRCDENFPQGPACPRCSARLVAREVETYEDTLHTVPGLKSIKVSRRYMRALERLSGPRASSSRALALALVMLVFASGFLLGRVGGLGPNASTVGALAPAKPVPLENVDGSIALKGSIAYVTSSREPITTIAMHHIYSGEVTPKARFSPPGEYVTTRVVSFGRSVAAVVSGGGKGFVAFAPHDQAPQGWVPGIEAAWLSERDLLVRHVDGSIARWTFGSKSVHAATIPDADELIQTSAGPIVRRGSLLETVSSPHRRLKVPRGARVVAVSPDLTRAVLQDRTDGTDPALWDGKRTVAMRNGGGRALGASFDRSSARAAIVLQAADGLQLAVVDHDGNAQLKPLSAGDGCEAPPVWDGSSDWVYVAAGDGIVHAAEAGGGRTESVRTQGVGCGVAWVDIT